MQLAQQTCIPCEIGTPPLEGAALADLLAQLGGGWEVVDGRKLVKAYRFPDFASALEFVDRVGAMAEQQGHHPDIYLAWGKVKIEVWTHKIDGLTESDFVFAAKADTL